ncbi:MAG: hypothetical protein B6U88_02795 [Candidatus Aenigmarchaeota archaeon ex4484_56]|nr:MAG: hypothetical protein B6U88_02795 [Candidatus Aenigmarchaeota archaeon ex4484_56]
MEFNKIQKIIEKKKITSKDCEYHTIRKLDNGKIRVLVINNTAYVEFICPNCKSYEYIEKEWKRPFSVKCPKCGYLIRVQKMKYLIDKERKGY